MVQWPEYRHFLFTLSPSNVTIRDGINVVTPSFHSTNYGCKTGLGQQPPGVHGSVACVRSHAGPDISCLLWATLCVSRDQPPVMWQLVMWDTGSGNGREQTRHHDEILMTHGHTHRGPDMEICDGDVTVLGKYFIALQNILNSLNLTLSKYLFLQVLRELCEWLAPRHTEAASVGFLFSSVQKFCNWWKSAGCVNKAFNTFSTQIYLHSELEMHSLGFRIQINRQWLLVECRYDSNSLDSLNWAW